MPIGAKIGPDVGVDAGVTIGRKGGINVTWAVDATSGVAMPINATEYADWRAAYGVAIAAPATLFRCNEAAGNFADSIGARVGVANGVITRQVAVTGWSTVGYKSTNPSTAWIEFPGENLNTTDVAMFAIMGVQATTGSMFSLGGGSLADATEMSRAASTLTAARRGGGIALSAGTYAGVIAAFIVCRQSAAELAIYIKQVGGAVETLTPVWSAPPGAAQTVYLSSGYEATGTVDTVNRVEYWTGANANITAAQVAAFFTARGI